MKLCSAEPRRAGERLRGRLPGTMDSDHPPAAKRLPVPLAHHGYLDAHHGQPRPSSHQPDYTLMGTNPVTAMQGQTTDAAPAIKLDKNVLR